jgi:hypothetical protein
LTEDVSRKNTKRETRNTKTGSGMEFIKKYKIVIAVVLPILILVLIRSFSTDHFKNDIKKWAEPSVVQTNTISLEKARSLNGKSLFINLGKEMPPLAGFADKVKNIPADSVLNRDNISSILNNDGPVMLYSSDPALSARIWMLISQMGRKNIYIITADSGNEVLKYKFRPDTILN